ncbi:unnamed protein product [Prunus armeniaca]|uniref:Protein kinase domain-containing protein n=1 Tax=Prunus armeniaca TaxID=36596 RepID=A0A6J5W185_PRUAR|nr:unnamed protein product [Prunus armeniaca]
MAQDDGICAFRADYCWKCSDLAPTQQVTSTKRTSKASSLLLLQHPKQFRVLQFIQGTRPNKINAIALCRGDLSRDSCQACLNKSTDISCKIVQLKRKQSYGRALYGEILIQLDIWYEQTDPLKHVPSPNFPKNPQQFALVLTPLLDILSDRAASGNSLKNLQQGMQLSLECTPDIDKQNCSSCLKQSVTEIPICCGGRNGGRVLRPSCNLRYENNSFFASEDDSSVDIPAPVPAAPAPKEEKKKSNIKQIVIIIVVVLVAFVTILSSICIFLRLTKRRVKLDEDENSEDMSLAESLQYDFETIRTATDDFSDANKLGGGGFGAVYKTIKWATYSREKALQNSEQGDREFKNEVMLLAQLQHRNLVRLLGFCLKTDERLLIYEYVPNKSLDHFIFDPNNHEHLDWDTRYKIIEGIARGILYLHEDSRVRIIHRDLKASNILLNEDMTPKIADFGMARLFAVDQTQGVTKTVRGTYGYMAPEYVIDGRFSVKTDVFSFGVLVLEIVSGKKIGSFRYGENEEDLLTYAWRNWREDTIPNIIDPVLTTSSQIETMRCIHIGLLCVQQNVVDRPTTVSVVSMLNSQSIALPVPSQPAFYMHHNTGSDISALTESDQSKSLSVYVTASQEMTLQI